MFRGRRKEPNRITKPLPLQWTWGERVRVAARHPILYWRHRKAKPNTPETIVPMLRNAKSGRLVERKNLKYTNEPPRTKFVPLRHMPSALFRFGKIRQTALSEPREVELQYTHETGWHPVNRSLPRPNLRKVYVSPGFKPSYARANARANARRAKPRANTRANTRRPKPRTNVRANARARRR